MRKSVTLFLKVSLIPLLTACTSFLYYPNAYRYVDESQLERPPQQVEFSAAGVDDLLSWYFEAAPEARWPVTILFAHGNGQNLSAHFRSLYWALSHGLNFLIVGYPGYGPNEGRPSPHGTIAAVREAAAWVRKNRPGDALLIFGQSLGGNIALRTLSENPDIKPCAVVIEGSFSSYQKIARDVMSRSWLLWPFQWAPFLVIDDNRAIAGKFKQLPSVPYLVIHGAADRAVPPRFGQELYEKLPSPKQLWIVPGGKHIDTFNSHKKYRDDFLKFTSQNCLNKKS